MATCDIRCPAAGVVDFIGSAALDIVQMPGFSTITRIFDNLI
jgi:hypothetical protein